MHYICQIFVQKMNYSECIQYLYAQLPQFQVIGAGAYKPGLQNVEALDAWCGHPHEAFPCVHVAGTNGKGSVSNLLASVLQEAGYKVGLFTSPHLKDFRERIRVNGQMISQEDVCRFTESYIEAKLEVQPSFFELTTMMAFQYFAQQQVDIAIIEVGLGGRLDSTNIIRPILSVITSISFDHVALLGDTLPQIAKEKAGIIKPLVPVVVGESHPETDEVFERKVLYTNLPEPAFMGNRSAIMSLLTFADRTEPVLWAQHEDMLREMDLKGEYQQKNLRTALAALAVILVSDSWLQTVPVELFREAIVCTASRTGFRGRWEKISDNPYVICDIGHNEHGLKYNFAQLSRMKESGEITDLIIVYGSVADKDVDSVIHLMPEGATYIFTQANGKRALSAEVAMKKYVTFCEESGRDASNVRCVPSVSEARRVAEELAASLLEADPSARPLIYIGGSTYVVSEAVAIVTS